MDQPTEIKNKQVLEYALIDDYREKMRFKMGIRISIFFIAVFLTLIVAFSAGDHASLLGYIAGLSIASIMLVYLLVTKSIQGVFVIYGYAGAIIAQTSCSFIPEATHYVDFIWIIATTFIVYLGAHKLWGHILLVFNALGIAYFIFFRHNIHISIIDQSSFAQLSGAYLEILLSLFVLAYIMHQFFHFQEYSDKEIKKVNASLLEQNQIIEKQYNENVMLVKEIHHRVKNNLQIIVSLLRLQKNELVSQESAAQFQEAINRVLVMSSIHQKLYQQDNLEHIDLNEHLDELISELKILFDHNHKVEINIECELTTIDLKTMVPVGLLVNELLSNSFKYAFKNKDKGKIDIKIFPKGLGFHIVFKDDGEWLGDTSEDPGFGLELIEVFTNQLNGERTFQTNDHGTEYVFELQFAE